MTTRETTEKGLFEHVDDLSGLILRVGIAILLSTLVAFLITPHIFTHIIGGFKENYGVNIGTITPAEILIVELKMSFLGGIVISSPITIPMIWSYVRPALKSSERKVLSSALIPATFLFLSGFTFAYLVIIPIALRFLVNLSSSFGITPFWTISSCVSLVVSLGIAFGAAFELPIVVIVISRLGIVTAEGLSKARRYVVVAILIAAALVTPPDVASQLLLAGPLILLYELSLIFVRLLNRK